MVLTNLIVNSELSTTIQGSTQLDTFGIAGAGVVVPGFAYFTLMLITLHPVQCAVALGLSRTAFLGANVVYYNGQVSF